MLNPHSHPTSTREYKSCTPSGREGIVAYVHILRIHCEHYDLLPNPKWMVQIWIWTSNYNMNTTTYELKYLHFFKYSKSQTSFDLS